jgi:hypothetical protein
MALLNERMSDCYLMPTQQFFSYIMVGGCVIVLNATFNNISVISKLSVLLVEETGVPRENQ